MYRIQIHTYLYVFKKYRDWSCIYQDRNEQAMKCQFSSKFESCSKYIETKAIFAKTKINNEWNINPFSKYKVCSKSIETDVVFTQTAMKNEWIFISASRQYLTEGGDFKEGEGGHELRFVPYRTMLVIGLLGAMWARWTCLTWTH